MKKTKTTYIDGFVLVVPEDRVEEYRQMAQDAGKMWIRHGALAYKECVGDDLHPDMSGASFLPFSKLAGAKSGETVWFSYIEYESREHRDAVNKKVMQEMEVKQKDDSDFMKNMPFDMERLAYGGFAVAVDL